MLEAVPKRYRRSPLELTAHEKASLGDVGTAEERAQLCRLAPDARAKLVERLGSGSIESANARLRKALREAANLDYLDGRGVAAPEALRWARTFPPTEVPRWFDALSGNLTLASEWKARGFTLPEVEQAVSSGLAMDEAVAQRADRRNEDEKRAQDAASYKRRFDKLAERLPRQNYFDDT